jgi:diacylglycerol O-acyltransferase
VPKSLHAQPGESERHALQRLCGELAMTPLDPRHPLWQFHLVEDYEGGSALVARIHHCIGDGIALISVMMSITDGGTIRPGAARRSTAPTTKDDWLNDAVLKPSVGADGQGHRHVQRWQGPRGRHSGQPAAAAAGQRGHGAHRPAGRQRRGRAGTDARRLAHAAQGQAQGQEDAWPGASPSPLDDVKTVGKALGCTVNDVLLSCVAGAIGEYLLAQGQDPAGKEIRAMVPVNLRPLEKAWQLGNRFGLAPLVLPIGIANPVERVYAVRRRMGELKGSYQPLLAFAVLSVSGLFIKPVQDAILGLFAKKATAVMTNVPGPAVPLLFCGSTLRQNMFWVPSSGDIGVGVSILSYGGGVQFGLITDEQLCPEPQAIIDLFEPEFDKLLWLGLMLPWPGQDEA